MKTPMLRSVRARLAKCALPQAVSALLLIAFVALVTVVGLQDARQADAATFVTNAARLAAGDSVVSASSKNGNRTRFQFSELTTNDATKTKAAFVQWAPLLPKAGAYKNGTLVDQDQTVRLWINGIWYSVTFDGDAVHIR